MEHLPFKEHLMNLPLLLGARTHDISGIGIISLGLPPIPVLFIHNFFDF